MKKNIIILLTVFSLSTYAQNETNDFSLKSKKGKEILPQKGDFGIGIEGTQFIDYVGNFFNQSGNNTMRLNLPNDGQTFCFKYVSNPRTFYRAKLRLGLWSAKENEYVPDAEEQDDPESTVEDTYSLNQTNVELAFGIEKRKGENRLQGFYGAEAGVFFSKFKESYEYGNDIEDANSVDQFSKDFGNNIDHYTNEQGFPMRVLENANGSNLGLRLGLFVGAEYFFAPKISAAGEFGWNIIYSQTGEGTTEFEYYNDLPSIEKEEDYTQKTAGESLLYIDNTPTGMLTLNLYF